MKFDFLQSIEKYLGCTGQLGSNFKALKDRTKNPSHKLPLEQHVRGLVYSKLSQGVKWKSIESKQNEIDELFNGFTNIDFIRQTSAKDFYDGLSKLQVGRFRKSLAYNLHDNIKILEDTLKDKECCGNYEYIRTLAEQLKGFGIALVCEYLSWLNIDRIKPDVYISSAF